MPEQTPCFEARTDHWITRLGLGKGAVAAIFPHSFDLLINGTLVNGHLRKDALHPLSLLVSEDILETVHLGMPVEIQEQHLRLGSGWYSWQGTINPPRRVPDAQPSAQIIRKALGIVCSLGRPSPLSSAWLGLLNSNISGPALSQSNHSGEWESVVTRVHDALQQPNLDLSVLIDDIGKGEGLTPSFDDVLSGILLARKTGGGSIQGKETFLSALPGRTTPTSIWQLEMALEGFSSLRFEQLLTDLQKSSLDLPNVLRCLHTGHSSGTDLFCGILAGFDPMVALAAERKE